EIACGVDERLTLLHARAGARDVDGVGGETLLGELEGDARAGRRFEEQVDDRLAAQHRDFLDRPLADLLEGIGGVQDAANLFGREPLESDEILPERRCGRVHDVTSVPRSSTACRPSRSGTSTSTPPPCRTCTTAPTTSGWIGSSRPPRSTSTQRKMRSGRPKSASSSSAARTVRPV